MVVQNSLSTHPGTPANTLAHTHTHTLQVNTHCGSKSEVWFSSIVFLVSINPMKRLKHAFLFSYKFSLYTKPDRCSS